MFEQYKSSSYDEMFDKNGVVRRCERIADRGSFLQIKNDIGLSGFQHFPDILFHHFANHEIKNNSRYRKYQQDKHQKTPVNFRL